MSDDAAPTRPRRRWFRFSLRSLLLFTVLVGSLMGWIAKERMQSAREMKRMNELWELEWGVGVSDEFYSPNIPKTHVQKWWDQLSSRIIGQRIGAIAFDDPPHRAEIPSRIDLKPLAGLSNLQLLDLRGAPVRDLTPVAGITSLRFVSVCNTPISREQIDALQKALPQCKIEHDPFP